VATDAASAILGIRYAQPPTGHLRWAPPRPVTPWKGVRSAEAYGNRCPALPSTNGPQSLTEDCLFLNVQRPAKTRSHERLPVYVWIHGGGLVNGSSNQHESGSCPSWPQADADSSADQVTSQVDCPATADPAAIACLRRVSVQALLDAGNNWNGRCWSAALRHCPKTCSRRSPAAPSPECRC
jgi:hypothetical protein